MNSNRLIIVLFASLFASCGEEANYVWKSAQVTASAYNSTPAQTDGLPTLAAWGDTLSPDMKAIAVSRDLVAMGLDRNTRVTIEGFEGVFLVKDKMGSRWKKRIDIYMGDDIKKAREWGVKEVEIQFRIHKDSTKTIQ
ncbi:hypothetical protein RQM65_18685 [Pricia sp. S334]|uniref:3D (Asp-Asp-Asp) domain-containing protein n=1 Tax=Pricia mediterranea TaxID=3076079 RepID=A0ABU3LAU5_9FLAO|nr:hypothetical protein [Pricia sp. S334]MDT7830703.1 hypothetical protein [Pricia sp. S334]